MCAWVTACANWSTAVRIQDYVMCVYVFVRSFYFAEHRQLQIKQDNVQRTRSLSNANSKALQDISIQIYIWSPP